MPVIRVAPLAGLVAAGVLAAGPSSAQSVVVDAGAIGVKTLVPPLKGAGYPATLGPPRAGTTGRPRGYGRITISMEIVPACSMRSQGDAVSVHCSDPIPFRTLAAGAEPGDPVAGSAAVHHLLVEY